MGPLVLIVVHRYGPNLLHHALKKILRLLRQFLCRMYNAVFVLKIGKLKQWKPLCELGRCVHGNRHLFCSVLFMQMAFSQSRK